MARSSKYPPYAKGPKAEGKMKAVMHEWAAGGLHSGSKKGPIVTDQAQAIAIGLAQARKAARRGYRARA